MSTLSQFGGVPATRAIVNAYSSGGVSTPGINNTVAAPKTVLSGALTAATLATLLTVSGPGQIPYLALYVNDATSRTIRLQVIVDGVTVFDATSDAITASGRGIAAAAQIAAAGTTEGAPIRFNSSCVVKVASSLTETDKVTLAYKVM